MALDWEKIEEENKERNKKYKEYAPEGTYTTKLESVELVTAKTGNTGIRFNLKETDEYKFPKYGASFYNTDKHNWRRYHMKEVFVAVGASEEQARKAVETCEEYGYKYKVGNLLSTDFFYHDNPQMDKWMKMGVLAVEMEVAALYMNAARAGKRALAICTVSDSIITGEKTTAEERQTTFTNMMDVAFRLL